MRKVNFKSIPYNRGLPELKAVSPCFIVAVIKQRVLALNPEINLDSLTVSLSAATAVGLIHVAGCD